MNNNSIEGMHAGAKPEIFRFAQKLRCQMTQSEVVLWNFLKYKPLGFKFRRQHPFGVYILDFYCHKVKLTIEVDGKYHDFESQKKLDEMRTHNIIRMGLTELRFTNEEVLSDIESVKKNIFDFLKKDKTAIPHP